MRTGLKEGPAEKTEGNLGGRRYRPLWHLRVGSPVRAAGWPGRFGPKVRCYCLSDSWPVRLRSLTLLSIISVYSLTAGSLVGPLALRLSRSALLLSWSRRVCSSCSNVASLRASCWANFSFIPSSVPSRSARIFVTSSRLPRPLCRSL